MSLLTQLPVPSHFDRQRVGEVWRVPYQTRATEAKAWAKQYGIQPAERDQRQVGLLLIDVQNTFCIPEFELFVGGRSGLGAVEDNIRLCEFIYRNLGVISEIALTMDTHTATQIFHPVFWINEAGEHPAPMTMISLSDVETGVWKVNPAIAHHISGDNSDRLQIYALHYVQQLQQNGKYLLTIWPYHSMLGGIGHAIVSAVEEACFFHAMARDTQTHFEMKGDSPLTENYSVLKPEVAIDHEQQTIGETNHAFLQKLLRYDALIVAGQAKSHCVAWTVEDLLNEIQAIDPALAQKVYLLEDCSSPVVVPSVVDFTDDANKTYDRFAAAGMHRIQSTDAIDSWLKI
ncbi:isochorismatase [Leptolyngbya ohadii]|uniref:isochorismatase n=1 Tax=Leptolyngbya ohadii TaxID=1962290 RepID=UPI000B59F6A7|nr:isochorismatase [Leptolyngbya ohadii]